jgi:altronate dehydratase
LQVVDAPFAVRVTLTIVPNGRLRWAQVPSGALNHEATPLSDFVSAPVAATAGGAILATSEGRGEPPGVPPGPLLGPGTREP